MDEVRKFGCDDINVQGPILCQLLIVGLHLELLRGRSKETWTEELRE